MSMATSLELRVPFLDYRLVEWANRQPIGVKIGRFEQQNVTKRVLRTICQEPASSGDYRSAEEGIPGPGMSLAGRRSLQQLGRSVSRGDQARLKHLFQPQEMERQLRRAAAGDQMSADKSWLLIVLETWLREFDVDPELEVSPADARLAGAELGRAVLPVG